jgi:hypothetical protein
MIGKTILLGVICAALMSCCGARAVAPATAAPADIVVTPEKWISGLTVALGATFRIPKPATNEQWTVTYPHNILRSLTAADRMERPDAEGWRFEAIARGAGDLTFTGFVPPDRGDQPNPPRFVLHVSIQ